MRSLYQAIVTAGLLAGCSAKEAITSDAAPVPDTASDETGDATPGWDASEAEAADTFVVDSCVPPDCRHPGIK